MMLYLSKKCLLSALFLAFIQLFFIQTGNADNTKTYIGSKNCAPCHEEQYNSFIKHSKKAHSWNSVAIMKPKLKEHELQKCYECHTTGYNKGGFKSIETTPELADVGCETCHGPGSEHAENQDPQSISRKPAVETCTACHNPERIQDFKFKPLIFSGAH
ncbi:cytochrome c family protein [Desulfovibrio desulfuricans]|uniref:cytochrome c family protein n=1 Tax=Desulfovibrio desulfuricans TaxID=876 RepID=UPI0003B56BF9|nr:cytochrome c family protein [Desulfovibrio desulfuricans]MDD3684667.1 cytochrome c family protein [Desulfovibrio desulfuricans]